VVIAPPANTQIVFTSNRDNVQRIYRMDWNGRNQQLIPYDIDGSVGETSSSYSAVRNALVFAALVRLPGGGRQQDIFSSTWLSVDFRQLTGRQFNNWHPVWSPNGQRIAFVSSRDGGSGQLYVMNADGSAQRRITRSNALDDEPAWSPDNRTLVFSSTRAGGQARQLYRVDVETGAVVTLTRGLVRDTHPWWSADGRTIVFARVADKNGNGRLEDDEANIWRMNADGGEPRNLTNSQTNEGDPALSPDGNWIVFARYMGGRTRNDIFMMTVNGDQPTQLTTTEGDDGEPRWVWPR
jgi:tol-pal system beta propeller repeat protein TolB